MAWTGSPCGLLLIAAVVKLVFCSPLNYNVYHYDMTTPMFTPDGRLLQVEYASLAPTHSSPLLVVTVEHNTILMVQSSKHRGQDRLVILNDVVVGLSGVLSDSVALLQKVLKFGTEQFRLFGISEYSVDKVAKAIGDSCQEHAFGGGIRPYGSVMIVAGLNVDNMPQVQMTDPSGATKIVNEDIVLVGGTKSLRDKIRKCAEEGLEQKHDSVLQQTLRVAARALADAYETNNDVVQEPWLEAVVISPKHGVYKLTDSQVEALLKEIPSRNEEG